MKITSNLRESDIARIKRNTIPKIRTNSSTNNAGIPCQNKDGASTKEKSKYDAEHQHTNIIKKDTKESINPCKPTDNFCRQNISINIFYRRNLSIKKRIRKRSW